MEFRRLPSNSEQLLFDLVRSENPAKLLFTRFQHINHNQDEELRGMLRELKDEGYLTIQWADNVPYYVSLSNSARTYQERLSAYNVRMSAPKAVVQEDRRPIIFISHRSTDKAVADMLVDFFSGTGMPRDSVFCSSLPGNDVNEKISKEVKTALTNSVVNIAILSQSCGVGKHRLVTLL